MAINETVYKGRKYRHCIDSTPKNKKWNIYSFWTAASDVEFNDGTTAEQKMGSFKGVTANEDQSAGFAADITLVRSIKAALINLVTSLSDLINNINDRLGGLRFYEDADGKWVVGADSVPKKLGSNMNALDDIIGNNGIIEAGSRTPSKYRPAPTYPIQINLSAYQGYTQFTADSFIIEVLEMQYGVYHYGDEAKTEYYINGAGTATTKIYREYDPATGILSINPNRSKNTYNDGAYDIPCNLNSGSIDYFKAKIYLK